jgi:isoaspartyl peptidase/L-asparaginase-like protein (Ntn-hydrolase superfamily)
MARTRRQFLTEMAGAGAALALLNRKAAAQKPAAELPLVIATWDYGLELCVQAQKTFATGGDVLDALEKGVNVVEDDPKVWSVGFNGLPNEDGVTQLDAAIMDGRTHRAGAVAALEHIKNPISVARKVMEKTEHVMIVGEGALKFARKMGFKEQELQSPEMKAAWAKMKRETFWKEGESHDTVACLGMDKDGNIATAVSTSGLPWKIAGRVGDSPIIGAGSYCDNEVGAAAATGIGELAIRNVASFAIVERMRAGLSPTKACEAVIEQMLKKHPYVRTNPAMQLAFIALNKQGEVGAAVVRKQKKLFRYALMRGLKTPPALHDVKPMVG